MIIAFFWATLLLAGSPEPQDSERPDAKRPQGASTGAGQQGLTTQENAPHDGEPQNPPPAPLTTEVRAIGAEPLDIPMLVLKAPETMTEALFVPLLPLILALEKWKIHRRLFDFLTNDEHTLAVLPIVDFFNISGLGAGAALIRNRPLGSEDRMILLAMMRQNRDRVASFSYSRRLRVLSGRVYNLKLGYEVDRDVRYFGIDGARDQRRLLRRESIDISTGLGLRKPLDEWSIDVTVAYRQRSLGSGVGNGIGVTLTDEVGPPPGFERRLDYPELGVSFGYDSRDSFGRTTRGARLNLEALVTQDLNGAETSTFRSTARVAAFLPLFPLGRVLFFSFGVSLNRALVRGGQVPLHRLVTLGGSRRLRGYPNDRFVGLHGWWSTLEYRYKIYEYGNSGNGLSTSLFVDTGNVGSSLDDLVSRKLPYAVGVSLRAENNLFLLGRFQFAVSPEGVRISFGIGEGI